MFESRFCYCGHFVDAHIFEIPLSTFDPDLPDPEPKFKRCEGYPKPGLKERYPEVCACSKYQPFPLGTYRHLKTDHLYVAYGLEFDSETRAVRVQYTRVFEDPIKSRDHVKHGERWSRPIHAIENGKAYGFLDPDAEGRPRFERLTPMYAVELVNGRVRIPPPFEVDTVVRDAVHLADELADEETPEFDVLRETIKELTEERDMWKRRAAAHGCDLDNGDIDCG